MGQASVLNESEIRRVFRIIETTCHVERNRLCFVLSLYSGLRVGEIAALTIGDVAAQSGNVRREIKLGVHQTKGSQGRTVILSERVRKEIASFFKNKQPNRRSGLAAHCITAQWSSVCDPRCPCCSRKSTKRQAFERPRIRADGPLQHASTRKASECEPFKS